MHWSDERYVKLYSRDTPGWMLWPWQARALLPLLLRRLDGAGVLECGRAKPVEAVAIVVGLPVDVVSVGLEALVADGVLESVDRGLLMPNYIEAQEATKTEAKKKRDQRERHRAQARAVITSPVPECPVVSPSVPECPPPAYPSLSQPIPAQPSLAVVEAPLPPPTQVSKPPLQFDLMPPDETKAVEEWTREDFWRWAECRRRAAGLAQERWPNPSKLRDWWQEARPAAEVAVLKETFLRFGDEKKWQQARPPLPFAAFMTQWNQYLPRSQRDS